MDSMSIENLVNAYLFDMSIYAVSEDEANKLALSRQRSTISKFLHEIDASELLKLQENYRVMSKKLKDEAGWRESRGMANDMSIQMNQQVISEILEEIEGLCQTGKKSKRIGVSSSKKATSQLLQETTRRKMESHTTGNLEETVKRPNVPGSSSSKKNSTRTILKEKATRNVVNSQDPKPPLAHPKPTASSDQLETEDIEIGEILTSSDQRELVSMTPSTPQDKISAMVSNYLSQRPQIDWQQRDRIEGKMKQELFAKEIKLRQEKEEMQQTRSSKSSKVIKASKDAQSSKSSTCSQDTKVPKKWWLF